MEMGMPTRTTGPRRASRRSGRRSLGFGTGSLARWTSGGERSRGKPLKQSQSQGQSHHAKMGVLGVLGMRFEAVVCAEQSRTVDISFLFPSLLVLRHALVTVRWTACRAHSPAGHSRLYATIGRSFHDKRDSTAFQACDAWSLDQGVQINHQGVHWRESDDNAHVHCQTECLRCNSRYIQLRRFGLVQVAFASPVWVRNLGQGVLTAKHRPHFQT